MVVAHEQKTGVTDSDAVSKCSEVKFSDSHVHMVTGNDLKDVAGVEELKRKIAYSAYM